MKLKYMTKELLTLQRGAVIIPRIKFKILTMDISDYSQFRPAIQSKDFDKDRQEFHKQCSAFYDFVTEALKEDRVYKICRKNPKAELVMLPEDSPVQDELKDQYAEVTFIVKLK